MLWPRGDHQGAHDGFEITYRETEVKNMRSKVSQFGAKGT